MLLPSDYKKALQSADGETLAQQAARIAAHWPQDTDGTIPPVLQRLAGYAAGPASPPAHRPNGSTLRTLLALADTLLEVYPLPGHPENSTVYDAFQRYAERAMRPNPLYSYIHTHLADGFSHDEWAILSTGLALRVVPTIPDLQRREAFSRTHSHHSTLNMGNNAAETGDGKQRSHMHWFMKSLQATRKMMGNAAGGDLPMLDNICMYEMIRQIIRFRKKHGIAFAPEEDLDAAWQRYDHAHDRTGMNAHHRTVLGEGVQVTRVPGHFGIPHTTVTTSVEGLKLGHVMNTENELKRDFAVARRIAALLPDAILEYDERTQDNLEALNRTNGQRPGDAAILTNEFELLSRECNADKGSHIEAWRDTAKAHLGYLGPIRSRAAWQSARNAVMDYADIHVGPTGVEEDHADQARRKAFGLLVKQADDTPARPAAAVAEALNFVVDHGYFHLQYQHMDLVVQALAESRQRALANHEALIQPKDEIEPELPLGEKIATGWREVIAGMNRPGNLARC